MNLFHYWFQPDRKNFHVDVKGLVFNNAGKLMLLKEPTDTWDLPGGRMEHGETFEQAIKRECREEMGVECTLLDQKPLHVWPHYWPNKKVYLVYLAFPIKLESYDFITSNECCGYDFFTPGEMKEINLIDSVEPLRLWLKKIV